MSPERFDELRANAHSDASLISAGDVIECLEEIARLATETYVPGSWYCPKCGFELVCSILHFQSGNIGVDRRHPEACPNDGATMQPGTWKRDATKMSERMPDAICMARINLLRQSDASSVTIYCDNAGDNDLPNCCIEVWSEWTDWTPKEFRANSLIEALAAAEVARGVWNQSTSR